METVKCILVGDTAVGKRQIINTFMTGIFTQENFLAFDTASKYIEVDGKRFDLRPSGIERVAEKWVPEIRKYCPETPFILMGTKMDIRDKNCRPEEVIQSRAVGKATAKSIGAEDYMECSSLVNVGLKEIFQQVLRLALRPKEKREQNCKFL